MTCLALTSKNTFILTNLNFIENPCGRPYDTYTDRHVRMSGYFSIVFSEIIDYPVDDLNIEYLRWTDLARGYLSVDNELDAYEYFLRITACGVV